MPINFNQPPYYDDFTEDDLMYKLLFQPGRAVQARELTQIQSILQSQISTFGKHVFKDGSLVTGGRISYDKTNIKWLAIKELDFKGQPNFIRSITPGLYIRRSAQAEGSAAFNPRLLGKITQVFAAENGEPDTIYFRWTEGEPEEGDPGFGSNENLIVYDYDRQVARFPITTLDARADGSQTHYGNASEITVAPGIYFWKGMFIKSNGGSLVLGKYNQNTTYRVGFSISEQIVTDDPKALDPASGASNYAAPGADRYKIKLQLQKFGDGETIDDSALDNFIEIARIDAGDLVTSPTPKPLYNILGDYFAKRTYEESGNYLVKPYNITVKNKTSADNPKLIAKMSDGISYVRGHRRTLTNQNTIEIPKGRDIITKELEFPLSYGDNRVLIYDYANSSVTHPENANGIFTVGSGAGVHTSNLAYGERGAAVSLHCVPQQLVKDHSLSSEDAWNSTLVGTARPMQMSYDKPATIESVGAGRPGTVYSLWLDDFNSSPINSTVSVSNFIDGVTAYGNSTWTVYHFTAEDVNTGQNHGITTNDSISVTGQDPFNITDLKVGAVNSSSIMINTGIFAGLSSSDYSLGIKRTTGNTTSRNTVVLNESKSAAWNDSYVGATIRVNDGTTWSAPRTIVGYVGTNGAAETKWFNEYNPDHKWSKRATVILDRDLDIIPKYGYTYELILTAKQARSVVYNQNKSSTGAEQYPARLNQSWNIDPISGVVGGDVTKLNSELYGNRIDGDCLYNQYGDSSDDCLLYDMGRHDPNKTDAIKTVKTFGNLDTGMSSNTFLYYTEYVLATGGGNAYLDFQLPTGTNYTFFPNDPVIYPYEDSSVTTITDPDVIKSNYILGNRALGSVWTNKITSVRSTPATRTTRVTMTGQTFTSGQEYVLLLPVRAKFAEPAYKELVTGNTTHSVAAHGEAGQTLTSLERGQVFASESAYANGEGSIISLKKPDVFRLSKVVHMVQSASANTDLADASKDITDRFILHSGQKDMFYDNGYIELRKGESPTGDLLICFDYFKRMDKPKGEAGAQENLSAPSYFSVDSYQYTTDLLLNEVSPAGASAFSVGDLVTGNSGAIGYVVDFANTSGADYAKMRLESVSGSFESGNWVSKGTTAAKIHSVTTADLNYSEIPIYTSPSGTKYPLRNMIDARSYVSTNNLVSDTISNSIMPLVPGRRGRAGSGLGLPTKTIAGVDRNRVLGDVKYSHYAGRIDKLAISDTGDFKYIKGNHSDNPLPPREDPDGKLFTIATLTIEPYTAKAESVQIKRNVSVRHTMKDISKLARRVENLEYYVSLNALEQSAADLDISFADGTSRFKNGIIVDNFNGTAVRGIANDISCAIGSGVLRPAQETLRNRGAMGLKYISGGDTARISASGYHLGEPTFLIPQYDTEPMIHGVQAVATSLESVNPFDLQNFTGELTLTPDTDHWIDATKVPEYGAVLAGDRDNPIADLSSPLYSSLSPEQIAAELEKIDGLWESISGVSVGDDITGDVEVYNQDGNGGFNLETRGRNIELGDVSAQRFTALADIDAAIARAASIDGLLKTVEVLPYVRSRDIVINATGLKPSWPAGIFFEGIGIEYAFSRANEIYIVDNDGDGNPRDLFQPEIDGVPERIELTDSGLAGHTANALLVAVREPEFSNPNSDVLTDNNVKIGYIVPEFTDVDAGKVDWSTYKDGYYASNWSSTDTISSGFQGTSSTRKITGRRTNKSALLLSAAGSLYNGHYTGTARNADSANTTHLVLSPDAHRYVAKNFGSTDTSPTSGLPTRTLIKIVAGKGAGLECAANTLLTSESGNPVLELRTASDGTNPLNRSWGGGPGIDSTSVYSIRMQRRSDLISDRGISQLGYPGINTNRYGDKIGQLHLPAAYSRAEWVSGSKLIEIRDRSYDNVHLVKNYASAYYNSGGQRQVFYDDQTLTKLQEIRDALSGFRVGDEIPASDTQLGTYGNLGVALSVTVANGKYTSTEPHRSGPELFGDASATDANEMSAWQNHIRDLENMGYVWMEDLQKFVSIY
jgi:hypothetical protein